MKKELPNIIEFMQRLESLCKQYNYVILGFEDSLSLEVNPDPGDIDRMLEQLMSGIEMIALLGGRYHAKIPE
jgi:hypothetical protein